MEEVRRSLWQVLLGCCAKVADQHSYVGFLKSSMATAAMNQSIPLNVGVGCAADYKSMSP